MASYADKPWLKSYKLGPYKLAQTKEPYPKMPLYKILDDTATEYGHRAAISYLGREISYGELKLYADKLATALAELGVKKGDRVATIIPPCPQYIISDFAILKIGAAHVPCSTLHKADELIYEVGDSGAETVICSDISLDLVNSIKNKTKIKRVIVTSPMDYSLNEPELKETPGVYQFRNLIAEYPPEPPEVEIDPVEDLAILVFTGGATGLPKGVMLTHYNRVVNVMQSFAWAFEPYMKAIRGKASVVVPLPIFHQAGHAFIHAAIYLGLKIYLVPDPRDTAMIVEMLNKYRPFAALGVPIQYSKMCLEGLGRMQTAFVSGAAPLAPEVSKTFKKKTGMPITEAYGLTETGPTTHFNLSSFAKITGFMPFEKLGSIGVPIPDTEAKIVDLETGEEVPFGEEGELWVRGPQVMKGYWPEPGSGLVDGWLPTGDVARMDEEGYFYITDRVKDMANVSGFKVYTTLVDNVLYEHPAVLEAVAIGIPDPERPGSERIKAFVKLKEEQRGKITADDIISHCKGRLSPFAVPKFVEFREELPLTVTEKLFKRKLREEEIAKMKESASHSTDL